MRLISTLILGLALMGAVPAAQAQTAERGITVNATGEVSVPPDMATVRIAVQADAELAADALDEASVATAAILAQLFDVGIAAEDVRSGAIRLSPVYSQSALSSGNRITGYRAFNSVSVDVRELDRLGGLLAVVVGEGANRLDGVEFGLQDPRAATDEARRRAVAEGARLADLYAGAAGVEVGDLMSLSDVGGGGYRPIIAEARQMDLAASSPQFDVPTAPGTIDLMVNLVMLYAIAISVPE